MNHQRTVARLVFYLIYTPLPKSGLQCMYQLKICLSYPSKKSIMQMISDIMSHSQFHCISIYTQTCMAQSLRRACTTGRVNQVTSVLISQSSCKTRLPTFACSLWRGGFLRLIFFFGKPSATRGKKPSLQRVPPTKRRQAGRGMKARGVGKWGLQSPLAEFEYFTIKSTSSNTSH